MLLYIQLYIYIYIYINVTLLIYIPIPEILWKCDLLLLLLFHFEWFSDLSELALQSTLLIRPLLY